MLKDHPEVDDITKVATWLGTSQVGKVKEFLDAKGSIAIANMLADLCRFQVPPPCHSPPQRSPPHRGPT